MNALLFWRVHVQCTIIANAHCACAELQVFGMSNVSEVKRAHSRISCTLPEHFITRAARQTRECDFAHSLCLRYFVAGPWALCTHIFWILKRPTTTTNNERVFFSHYFDRINLNMLMWSFRLMTAGGHFKKFDSVVCGEYEEFNTFNRSSKSIQKGIRRCVINGSGSSP